MKLTEKRLDGTTIYEGRIITVINDKVELENGTVSAREVVRHPGGVCVAALSDDRCIYLVRQFRYPYQEVVVELPAGKLDKGNENPLEAGKRELLEETGIVADHYYDLGKLYPSPGYCDEIISMYVATGLHFRQQLLDEGEFLEVEKMPLAQAVDLVLKGEIKDSKSQAAILKLSILLERGIIE